jgi:hypothetical protein
VVDGSSKPGLVSVTSVDFFTLFRFIPKAFHEKEALVFLLALLEALIFWSVVLLAFLEFFVSGSSELYPQCSFAE